MKKIILNFISVLLILFVAGIAWYELQITVMNKKWGNVLNYSFFEVLSNSMEPTIKVKDDILIKVTKEVKEGDIVVFDDIENNDFIVHRIIKILDNSVITKGDNNNMEDSEISKERIIGKVIFIFPRLGIVQEFLRNPIVFVIILDVIIIATLKVNLGKRQDKEKMKERSRI